MLDVIDANLIWYFMNEKCKALVMLLFPKDNMDIKDMKSHVERKLGEIMYVVDKFGYKMKEGIYDVFRVKDAIIIAVGKDKDTILEEMDTMEKVSLKSRELSIKLMNILGVPKCCIERYMDDIDKGINPWERYIGQVKEIGLPVVDLDAIYVVPHPFGIIDKDTGIIHGVIPHIPCSPECKETLTLVSKIMSVAFVLTWVRSEKKEEELFYIR